jgi:hypothetical protein
MFHNAPEGGTPSMLFSRINTIARRAGVLLSVALALAVAVPAVASAQSAGGGEAPAAAAPKTNENDAKGVGKAANDLTKAAQNTKVTAQTIAVSAVSAILAIWALICLARKDFKEAAGLVALSFLAFTLITDPGQQFLQHTVGDVLGFNVPGTGTADAATSAPTTP